MPEFYSEEQYKTFISEYESLYDPNSPQDTIHLENKMRLYEKSRIDRGLPFITPEKPVFTPPKNIETEFETVFTDFDGYYDNFSKNYPEFDKPSVKLDLVDRYITEYKGLDSFEKDDFIVKNYGDITPENIDSVFQNLADSYKKGKQLKSDAEKIKGEATDLFSRELFKTLDFNAAKKTLREDLQKKNIDIETYEELTDLLFSETASKQISVLKPQKPQLDAFIDSLVLKTKGEAKKADEEKISSFYNTFRTKPTWEQDLILGYIMANGKEKSAEIAEGKSVFTEFGQSFGRIVSDMISENAIGKESALNHILDKNTFVTTFPEIKTKEDADAFLREQLDVRISLDSNPEDFTTEFDVLPEGSERRVTEREKSLINDSILASYKDLDNARKIKKIERGLDSFVEFDFFKPSTWPTTIATTAGGSFAVMGALAATRGGGIPLLTKGYLNTSYENIREKYPDISPGEAAIVSSMAAPIQAAFDNLGFKIVKSLPNIGKTVGLGESVPNVIAKRFLLRTGVGMTFETGVEVGQDLTEPSVQQFLTILNEDFKDVEWTEEMVKTMRRIPEYAVGMIGLSVLGSSRASYQDFKNIDSLLTKKTEMRLLGLSEDSVSRVLEKIGQNDKAGAVDAFREGYENRNSNLAKDFYNSFFDGTNTEAVQEKENIKSIRSSLDRLNSTGIIPSFRKLGDKFVLENRDGTFESYNTINELNAGINDRINQRLETMLKAPIIVGEYNSKITEIDKLFEAGEIDGVEYDSAMKKAENERDSALSESLTDLSSFRETLDLTNDINLFNNLSPNSVAEINSVFNENVVENAETITNEKRNSIEIIDLSVDENTLKDKFNKTVEQFKNDLLTYSRSNGDLSGTDIENSTEVYKGLLRKTDTIIKTVDAAKVSSNNVNFPRDFFDVEIKKGDSKTFNRRVQQVKTRLGQTNKLMDSLLTSLGESKQTTDAFEKRETVRKKYRNDLFRVLGGMKKSLSEKEISNERLVNALALTEQNVTDPFSLTENEKVEIIRNAANIAENRLKETYEQSLNDLENTVKDVLDIVDIEDERDLRDTKVEDSKSFFAFVFSMLNRDKTTIGEERAFYSNRVYNKDFLKIDSETFVSDFIKFKALEFIVGKNSRSTTQTSKLTEFIRTAFSVEGEGQFTEKFLNPLKQTISAARTELGKTEKRGAENIVTSYTDSILVLENLLGIPFETAERKGKVLIDSVQSIVDELNNNLTDVQLDNMRSEEDIFQIIDDIFLTDSTLQTTSGVLSEIPIIPFTKKRKTYFARRNMQNRILDKNDKEFSVEITRKGETVQISGAFAGYLLNIRESNNASVNRALEESGISDSVIDDIRKKINPNVDLFRRRVRDLILKENERSDKKSKNDLGFGVQSPGEFFFPVKLTEIENSMTDTFEIHYQSGGLNPGGKEVFIGEDQTLDLDFENDSINVVSMFQSYAFQSSHQRNVLKPLLQLKTMLSDKVIKQELVDKFGKEYLSTLYKAIIGVENNGIKSSFFSEKISSYLRNVLKNYSRLQMGYKLSTILVNTMAGANTLMDNPLPLGKRINAYAKVLGLSNLYGQNLSGKMTPKQIRDNKILQARLRQGANSLIAMSRQTEGKYQGPLKQLFSDVGRASLQPMSRVDAFMTTYSALAAFEAHYEIAIENGLSEEDAIREAEEGMARTLNRTAQPILISGKSVWEMEGNAIYKMLTLFKSENRKNLGLEIAIMKSKKGTKTSKLVELATIHAVFGTLNWVLRGAVYDLMRSEEDDEWIWSPTRLASNIILGPISGAPIFGTLGEGLITALINSIADDDQMYFGDGTLFGKLGSDSIKLAKTLTSKKKTDEEKLEEVLKTSVNFSVLVPGAGGEAVSGAITIKNVLQQLYDVGKD